MKKVTFLFALLTSLLFTLNAQQKYTDVLDGGKIVQLNSITSDLNLDQGNAKAIIPLDLPKGTTGFYFMVTVVPGKKDAVKSVPLAHQFSGLCPANWESNIMNYIDLKQTGRKTNVYILDGKENADGLANFGFFKYLSKYINQKSFVEYQKVTAGQDYFIGLENIYELKACTVKIDVIAVTE